MKPYNLDDLEDILAQIREKITYYKREKHELSALQCQDIRDDLSVLIAMLADIGADLYGFKLESAAKFEKDKAQMEEDTEEKLRSTKQPNSADRAKRAAKLLVSPDDMIKADKMNKLALNLYQIALPLVVHSISSRIGALLSGGGITRTAKDTGHEGPDYFDEMSSIMKAEKQVEQLESEIHD